MTRSKGLFGLAVVAAVGWAAASGRLGNTEELDKWFPPLGWFTGDKAVAQAPEGRPGQRTVAVEVGQAVKKKTPVTLDSLGNVTTIASVAVKPRIDSEIVGIHFSDGAFMNRGDLLVTLDSRAIEAQIAQAEGNLARDNAQLAGAERDLRRASELFAKGAGPQLTVENSKTQVESFSAAVKADLAVLENLKVQLSYCTIRAQISGRISQAAVKVGNFVRSADLTPIATINQVAPVYVTFAVPQRTLPEIRLALAEGRAPVDVIIPGESRHAGGEIAMVENTVDPSTGMVTVRALMPNDDQLLWPGTLVNTQTTVRTEEAIVVP